MAKSPFTSRSSGCSLSERPVGLPFEPSLVTQIMNDAVTIVRIKYAEDGHPKISNGFKHSEYRFQVRLAPFKVQHAA